MIEQTPETVAPAEAAVQPTSHELATPGPTAQPAAADQAPDPVMPEPELAEDTSLLACEWEGQHYELDIMSVNAVEFRIIKQRLGLTAGRFLKSMSDLEDLDADAAVALLWLFKLRAGVHAEMEDRMPVLQFITSLSFVKTPAGAPGGEAPKA